MAAKRVDRPGAERPALGRRFLEELIFAFDGSRRFTQDSPVLPDVWIYYGCEDPLGALDLLLTPHWGTRAGALARRLRADRLLDYRRAHPTQLWTGRERAPTRIAYTHANVAARLFFDELVRVVLPMTAWWSTVLTRGGAPGAPATPSIAEIRAQLNELKGPLGEALDAVLELARRRAAGRRGAPPPRGLTPEGVHPELFWMAGVIGAVAWTARHAAADEARRGRRAKPARGETEGCEAELTGEAVPDALDALDELLAGALEYPARNGESDGDAGVAGPPELVYLVNRNRPAGTAVAESGPATKADAARGLFNVRCDKLTWAVVDSGIDATHRAFCRRRPGDHAPVPRARPDETFEFETRVLKTYDFTRLRELLDPDRLDPDAPGHALPEHVAAAIAAGRADGAKPADRRRAERLERDLGSLRGLLEQGRDLDWALYEELLEMPHEHSYYRAPEAAFDHGTHVAGILAADWWEPAGEGYRLELQGICPDLRLYDLRVLGPPGADGGGDGGADDEFASRGGEEFVVIAALQFVRYLNESRDYVVVHGANLSLSINHDIANYACGRTPVCEECERLVAAGVVVVAAAGNQGYLRYHTHQGFKEGYHTVSITDPGNAEAVITVGATHRDRPHTYGVSYFSSRGPTGDGRAKPDLVAPGEKVTAPLPGHASGRKDGTSMAAPHVSGAAALLMARYGELVGDPRRVKELICSTATDLGRERYFQGAGMLDVLRAMQAQ